MEEILKMLNEQERREFMDAYNNYELTEKDSINIEFESTNICIDNLIGDGMRFIKTIYPDFRDFVRNTPEYRLEEILFVERKDQSGNKDTMFDNQNSEDRWKFGECYKLLHYIRDNHSSATPFDFVDIVSMTGVNEELISMCLSANNLNVEEHLDKVDTYVSKVKNAKGEPVVYRLYKGTVNIEGRQEEIAYVVTWDATTDRRFSLQVYNSIDNAKDAAACLVRVPVELHDHIVSIRRQGEKYLFEYNLPRESKEFKDKFNSEYKYIDGNKYFNLLKYEC